MPIYYLMIEAVPKRNNPESKTVGGAYVNCWVKAPDTETALSKAKKYVASENWKFVELKNISVAQRHYYVDEPDSLECFDNAWEYGLGACFYTWPVD